MAAILELDNVSAHYGRIQALRGVSLHVGEGEIVTIIGANGAGKSTTLMTICGVVRASEGDVRYMVSHLAASYRSQPSWSARTISTTS